MFSFYNTIRRKGSVEKMWNYRSIFELREIGIYREVGWNTEEALFLF